MNRLQVRHLLFNILRLSLFTLFASEDLTFINTPSTHTSDQKQFSAVLYLSEYFLFLSSISYELHVQLAVITFLTQTAHFIFLVRVAQRSLSLLFQSNQMISLHLIVIPPTALLALKLRLGVPSSKWFVYWFAFSFSKKGKSLLHWFLSRMSLNHSREFNCEGLHRGSTDVLDLWVLKTT